MTNEQIQQLRNNGQGYVADYIEQLQTSEAEMLVHFEALMLASYELKEGMPDAFYKVKSCRSDVSRDLLNAHNLEQQAKGVEDVRFSRYDAYELLRLQGDGKPTSEDASLVQAELKIAEQIMKQKAERLRQQAKDLKK